MRPLRPAVLAIAVLAAFGGEAWADGYCSDNLAVAARRVVYNIGTWQDLNIFYMRYKDCYDDAIEEGLSDRVADLLARSWNTVGDLKTLADASPKFFDYVLEHVDKLMRPDQAKKILENVREHCPAGAETMCARIGREVETALPDLWGTQN